MKTEQTILLTSITTTEDVTKNLIIAVDGSLCDASEVPLGVINADTDSGEEAPVCVEGIALVKSGAAVVIGVLLKSDANSKAITTTTNNNLVIGKALDAATAADELIRVKLF